MVEGTSGADHDRDLILGHPDNHPIRGHLITHEPGRAHTRGRLNRSHTVVAGLAQDRQPSLRGRKHLQDPSKDHCITGLHHVLQNT